MKLVHTSEFALRLIGSPLSEDTPHCEVMLNRQPTGKVIDGAMLEAAIRWHDLLLVFVTDNLMHEEILRIYLLDASLNILDSAQLGWMYATGVFSLQALCPPNTVRFRFFGDTDWTLELFNEEVFAIPFFHEPRGVSRPFRFHRRFQISGNPKPESPHSDNDKQTDAETEKEQQPFVDIGHDKAV